MAESRSRLGCVHVRRCRTDRWLCGRLVRCYTGWTTENRDDEWSQWRQTAIYRNAELGGRRLVPRTVAGVLTVFCWIARAGCPSRSTGERVLDEGSAAGGRSRSRSRAKKVEGVCRATGVCGQLSCARPRGKEKWRGGCCVRVHATATTTIICRWHWSSQGRDHGFFFFF